jgi:predicted HAD superfamily Cof-like phosphohydrolase
MDDQIKMVQEFHEKFGVPVAKQPNLIPPKRALLRYGLMADEVNEYHKGAQNQDLPNIAKELADVLYACYGTILEHGLQDVMPLVFGRVHQSNMSKDYSESKMIKGSSYFEADLSDILRD